MQHDTEALQITLLNILSLDESFVRKHFPEDYFVEGLQKAAEVIGKLLLHYPGSPLSPLVFDTLFPEFSVEKYVSAYPEIKDSLGAKWEELSEQERQRRVVSYLIQHGIQEDKVL